MLDKELCNRISQSASVIIGHHVLVTDKHGVVLGSNDPARIGTLHGASLDVIASGQQKFHNQSDANRLSGTKPGTTIPLSLGGEIIGTIGITGLPEEASKYALLIQQLAQLFMDFQNGQQSTVHRDYKKLALLHDIISDMPDDSLKDIQNRAYELGYDLELPRIPVWITLESAEAEVAALRARAMSFLTEHFSHPQDFLCAQNDTELVVFALAQKQTGSTSPLTEVRLKAEGLMTHLDTTCSCLHVGLGAPASGVRGLHASYEDARLATRVLQLRQVPSGCLTVDEVFLEKLALGLSPSVCDPVSSPLLRRVLESKDSEQSLQLIECWCQTRFNFSKTAEILHIHKSTLVYRFHRMKELYQFDLYDFDQTMSLYLLHLRQRLLDIK